MRRTLAVWLAVAGLAVPGPGTGFGAVQAETYAIDRQHTNITFSWERLGISRQSGRISDFEGTLTLETAAPEDARLEVTMKAASLWTGTAELDRHLRSADFFDAARHPLIVYRSTAVKRTGERTAEVWGDLTMMGITKPVTMAVTLTYLGEHPLATLNANFTGKTIAAFAATARILRSDWGLSRGTPIASDEIEITINAELLRQ